VELREETRTSIAPFNLEIGRRLIIKADTHRGPYSTKGEVLYVSNHHFRVSTDTRVPERALYPNQEIRISIEGKKDILPVVTRFIRFLDNNPRVMILALPDGTWKRNRRAFFRGKIEASVTIIRKDGTAVDGRAVNISGGGILVETQARLMPKEELNIIIDFSDKERMNATVRVVRREMVHDCAQYGVKFLQIRRRDQDRICRMVIVQEFENRRSEIRELNENSPFRQ
jgi:c-di-GMP-binding flagellar brake protein YcgR